MSYADSLTGNKLVAIQALGTLIAVVALYLQMDAGWRKPWSAPAGSKDPSWKKYGMIGGWALGLLMSFGASAKMYADASKKK